MDSEDFQFEALTLNFAPVAAAGTPPEIPGTFAADGVSPTSTSLFDTPDGSPRRLGVTGGVGNANASKVGVIYVKEPADYCRGLIRGGQHPRWCMELKDKCSYSSHQRSKVSVEGDTWYIKGSRSGQVQSVPRLKSVSVPGGDANHLASRLEQPEVWTSYFNNCESEGLRKQGNRTDGLEPRALEGSGLEAESASWEDVQVPTISDFAEAEATMKTPGRPMGLKHPVLSDLTPDNLSDEDEVEEILTFPVEVDEVAEERFDELKDTYLKIVAANWYKIGKNFRALRSMMERDNSTNRHNFEEIVKEIGNIGRKTALLDVRIGNKPEGQEYNSLWDAIGTKPEGHEANSVWEAVDSMEYEQQLLGTKFGKMNAQRVESIGKLEKDVGEAVPKLERLAKNMNIFYQSYLVNMSSVERKLTELSETQSRSGAADPMGNTFLGNPFGTSTGLGQGVPVGVSREVYENFCSSTDAKLRALQVEASSVRLTLDSVLSRNAGGTSEGTSQHPIPVTDGTIDKRIDNLEERMKESEDHRGEVAYVTDDHHLSSVFDVKKVIEDDKVETCGLFWDLFSACVAMEPQSAKAKDIADETYSASRIGSTTSELELVAAMGHARPLTFFKADKKKADKLVCESYAEWIGEGHNTPFKKTMKDMMSVFISGKKGELKAYKKTAFQSSLLDVIKQQFNDLLDWIGEFYGELTSTANFPPVPAWELCSRCLGAVFEAQLTTRAEIARLTQFKTIHTKAQVIWVVLQCHVLTDQFVKVNFRSHPAVVQQVSLFLLTERVDPRELACFSDKIRESEKAAKEATNKAKQLGDTVDKLKSELGENKRKLNSLSSEIENLKRKMAKG